MSTAKTARPGKSPKPATEPPVDAALPRLAIVYWPIAKLSPYVRNPRKNDAAVDRMIQSIREFGFTIPVLARSSGEVIDGHLRLKAAVKLGNLPELPVIVCDGWTEAQVKAFRLMVNRSVAWAEWDMEALALEFGELKAADFDLALTGFDVLEADALLIKAGLQEGLTEEDAVPELPVEPVTVLGDLWLLGNHRVLCGDSTARNSVSVLLSPTSGIPQPLLMVTDPPYGVDYDPEWRNDAVQAGQGRGAPGGRAIGKVPNDDRADWHEAWALFPGAVAYVWHSALRSAEVAASLLSERFEIRAQIIWAKSHIAISRGHYHWQHEPCWYAVRNGRTANWHGDRTQTTLWSVPKPQKSETGHSTQKPVEVMRRPILNHTVPGDAVYDPFLGSGSCLLAAQVTGRVCYGLEIDPRYVDVIVNRWQEFTGNKATLDGDSRTFDQLRTERLAAGVAA